MTRKYRISYVLMTRAEAMEIREAHLQGKPVLALELEEACRVLSRRREQKPKLPMLPAMERARINASLAQRLAMACRKETA